MYIISNRSDDTQVHIYVYMHAHTLQRCSTRFLHTYIYTTNMHHPYMILHTYIHTCKMTWQHVMLVCMYMHLYVKLIAFELAGEDRDRGEIPF